MKGRTLEVEGVRRAFLPWTTADDATIGFDRAFHRWDPSDKGSILGISVSLLHRFTKLILLTHLVLTLWGRYLPIGAGIKQLWQSIQYLMISNNTGWGSFHSLYFHSLVSIHKSRKGQYSMKFDVPYLILWRKSIAFRQRSGRDRKSCASSGGGGWAVNAIRWRWRTRMKKLLRSGAASCSRC